MARPCKPITLQTMVYSNEDRQAREESEAKYNNIAKDKLKPPTYLNTNQKKIFKFITTQLEASGILTNLDIYILTDTCINLDRMQEIDKMVNKNPSLLTDRKLLATRKDAEQAFFRCCSELGLSVQARAKLASINVQSEMDKEDPLLKALKGDDDE